MKDIRDIQGKIVGERIFSLKDQIKFAEFANDWNPIHVDPLYARRCLTGQTVVHGIHVLLWALECWAKDSNHKLGIVHIHVQFNRPVFLGEHMVCQVRSDENSNITIIVSASTDDDAVLIHLTTGEVDCTQQIKNRVLTSDHDAPKRLGIEELDGLSASWELTAVPNMAIELFPFLVDNIGEVFTVILAQTSHLVGMRCPGLYSLFSELELNFDPVRNKASKFSFNVIRVDHRFNLVTTEVSSGGYFGKVRSFFRPPPYKQASFDEVQEYVSKSEFSGQRALIIGGSRGLGELSSKILAAGGADVCLTYHRGKTEAKEVVNEISDCDYSVKSIFLDIHSKFEPEKVLPHNWRPTHLYYFATPFIFDGERAGFSNELFEKFALYYVSGFAQLIEPLYKSELKAIFYPSTVALDELPTDMAEYCAAKAAGENLCELLMQRHKDLEINYPRLPRLATDQTASLLPVINHDPLMILLKLFRDFSNVH